MILSRARTCTKAADLTKLLILNKRLVTQCHILLRGVWRKPTRP